MNPIEQQFFNDLEKKLWTAADKLRELADLVPDCPGGDSVVLTYQQAKALAGLVEAVTDNTLGNDSRVNYALLAVETAFKDQR